MANSHEQSVDQARKAHAAALRTIWDTARSIKRDTSLTAKERESLLDGVYSPLSTKDVVGATANDIHKYNLGVSFRSSISHMRHVKKSLSSQGYRIALGSNPKMQDRQFALALGLPTPKTLVHSVLPEKLPVAADTIIKPVRGAGATGVFHVDSNLTIHSIKTQNQYSHISDALSELQGKPVLVEPIWLAEEVILGAHGRPAHDIKVYTFYGKVTLVIEIARGLGEGGRSAYCYYDADGNIIDIGSQGLEAFVGGGLPDDVLEKARRLSLESPVPFLRLDFHRGAERSFLGEITPHPGDTYAGDIAEAVDKSLGRDFVEAEARLLIDLLNGKTFEAYFASYAKARP